MLKQVKVALDAIHTRLTMKYATGPSELGIKDFFVTAVKNKVFPNKEVIERVRQLLDRSLERQTESVTELDYIVRALQRCSVTANDTYEWARFAFDALKHDQELFQEALEIVGQRKNMLENVQVGDRMMTVTLVHTDNPMALRASNYRRRPLTLIRNSRGQVQIIADPKKNLRLDTLMAMIRWMETPENERARLDWSDLTTKDGIHPTAPNWFYNRSKGQIFNGSQTHPGVKATEIHSQNFIEMIRHAFCGRGIGIWTGLRKIQTRRKA